MSTITVLRDCVIKETARTFTFEFNEPNVFAHFCLTCVELFLLL